MSYFYLTIPRFKPLVTALMASALCTLPLSGCQSLSPAVVTRLVRELQKTPLQQVHLHFVNRLPGGQTIPLVASSLSSLSFDGIFSLDLSALRADQPLEQVLPFIPAGTHLLEVTLKTQSSPLKLPVVVPVRSRSETLHVLIVLAFGPEGDHLHEIQVGYDQNRDQIPDPDADIYQSADGQNYRLRHPDGSSETWEPTLLKDAVAEETQEPIPPGTEKVAPVGTEPERPRPPEQAPGPIDVPLPPQPLPLPLPPA